MANEKDDKKDFGKVRLKNVRLSFFHGFDPQVFEDKATGEKRESFQANFLLQKGTNETKAHLAQMKTVSDAVKKKAWGDDVPKLKPDRVCLRDGDLENWDGYADHFYISSSNTRRPVIVDRDRSELKKADGKPYSGCYVNATIRVWAQKSKVAKDGSTIPNRLNASLEAVQFLRHGEAFGASAADPNEEFDDISENDDDLDDINGGDAEDDDGDLL